MMNKTELDKSYFVSFCIEQYKQSHSLEGDEVSEMFFRNGISDYLSDNYEVLHTQSRQWLMEEIEDRLKQQAVC